MDYEVFLVRSPGYSRPTRGISRLLRVHEQNISITTLSPSHPQIVEYSFESITNIIVSQSDPSEFSFDIMDNAGNTSTHTFICAAREKLLTTLFNRLDDLNGIGTDFNVKKHSNRAGTFVDVVLRLRSTSLVKMVTAGVRHERRKASNMKKINLQDITRIETLGDDVRLVLLHMKSRIWPLSLTKDALQFAMSIQRNIKTYLNRDIEIEKTTPQALVETTTARAAVLRSNPVLYEFSVIKSLEGGAGNQRERGLLITAEHLAEVSGEDIIGLHSLSDILGVVVSDKNDSEVIIEFREWRPTQYFIQDRDSFVGSLTDVMGLAKGTQFSVRMEHFFSHTFPEKPLPLYQNECEIFMISRFMSQYNTFKESGTLSSQAAQAIWYPLLKDYACNMHMGDSLIIDSRPLYAVAEVLRASLSMKPGIGFPYAVTCCIVLQRLLASRTCFDSIKSNPDLPKLLIQAMKSPNSVVSYSAAMTLRTCMKFYANDPSSTAGISGFLASSPAASEAANKVVVLSPDNLQLLVAQLQTHALLHQNTLHVLGVLEIFTLALNLPQSDAETEKQWINSVEAGLITAADVISASSRTRNSILFRTCAILLKTALTKCTPTTAMQLQRISRGRCVPLIHLRHAIFSKNERSRELSALLAYLMWEGSPETKSMLQKILPAGFDFLIRKKLEALKPAEESRTRSTRKSVELDDRKQAYMAAWLDTLDMLRTDTISTPVFVWNDIKRQELLKFLKDEVETFDRARSTATGHDMDYNSHDVELIYSALSDNNEICKTVVDGIHLEILVKGVDEDEPQLSAHWNLEDPVKLFHATFHALLVCFTPLYATSNLPEVEPRLAIDALTWIYERHPSELAGTMDNLRVIETVVAMLREAIENEHHVFAFKSVYFLLLAIEQIGRSNVFRFVKAGGIPAIIPLMVVALAKCCKDPSLFECDSLSSSLKDRGINERVPVVGADGEVRMARVPNGRMGTRDTSSLVQDGSLDARDAILWQDDSVPEKLQLGLALDLLETLLRLSGHESVEQYPPCSACQDLTRPEILFQLVQLLLRAKSPFFSRILNILSSLFKADKAALSGLYKFGVFEILLWKLLAGDVHKEEKSAICRFLFQTHLYQDPESLSHSPVRGLIVVEHIPWHESYLRMYLPPGLIAKLIQEGHESFRVKVEEEEDSPEVVWNVEMKAHLVERLAADLDPYVKARASDPQALFIYMPKPAVSYQELTETIFVAPLYLHNLLDTDQFPSHHVVDPSAFHTAVLQEYQRIVGASNPTHSVNSLWRQEVHNLVHLTQAQALILGRYPQVPLDREAEGVMIDIATPALRACIAQREDCSPHMTSILAHTAQVLGSIARTRDKDAPVSEAAINFALSVLSLGTRARPDGGFPESARGTNLEGAVEAALVVLEQAAATKEGRLALRDDIRWRKGFWWCLCSMAGELDSCPDMEPSASAFSALDCLNHFSGDMEMCYRVLKQGLLLPLILLAIPSEEYIGRARARQVPEDESDLKSRALEQVACQVLRTLAITLDQAPESDPSPRLQLERGLLATIIPLAMLTSLKNPDAGAAKFLAMAGSDLDQPTAIWNPQVRAELKQKVCERIQEYNLQQSSGESTTDDELAWLEEFRFDSLKDELVIAGVFVKGYATGHWEHFDLPDGRAFLDSLQDYLDANKHVLLPPGSRPDTLAEPLSGSHKVPLKADLPATEEDYQVAMAALGECLRYALEDNKKGMLAQVRYPLLTQILAQGSHIPAIQMEVAAISQVLAQHPTSQEQLLSSPLLPVMALHIWKGLFSTKEVEFQLACTTLDSLLELCREMPASIPATNRIASSGALFVVLAIFFQAELPGFDSDSPDAPLAGSVAARHDVRVVAAQILGHLLLASTGVERRSKLVKDLEIRRSVADLPSPIFSAPPPTSFGTELTDMYEILLLLEPGVQPRVEPWVVQTLFMTIPLQILSLLARHPTHACNLFDSTVCNPLLVWNDSTRSRCRTLILSEATRIQAQVRGSALVGLPEWHLPLGDARPVFLGFVRASVLPFEEEASQKATLFSESSSKGYVRELYIGGFYVDQLLREPAFELSPVLEGRVIRELRKWVVVAAPSDGAKSAEFDFDDRRRLLLALLTLYRYRPSLLTGSNIDIFLPVFDFINGGSSEEKRGLTQAAFLLFHCTINSSDIADFVVTEDLLFSLSLLLNLRVPVDQEGEAGTDPRLCSLMLLLRLVRYSSKATKMVLESDVVGHMAAIVLDAKTSPTVRSKAVEVLSVMCADRRVGHEVSRAVESLIPQGVRGQRAWQVNPDSVADDVIDNQTMQHFLAHRFPSQWWAAESAAAIAAAAAAAPEWIVEATVRFPGAKVEDFDDEGEDVFRHSVAGIARVDLRNVRLVKRAEEGAVVVAFEVQFPRMVVQGVIMNSKDLAEGFMGRVKSSAQEDVFVGKFFERLGDAEVLDVGIRLSR